jgi:hypothetical protein
MWKLVSHNHNELMHHAPLKCKSLLPVQPSSAVVLVLVSCVRLIDIERLNRLVEIKRILGWKRSKRNDRKVVKQMMLGCGLCLGPTLKFDFRPTRPTWQARPETWSTRIERSEPSIMTTGMRESSLWVADAAQMNENNNNNKNNAKQTMPGCGSYLGTTLRFGFHKPDKLTLHSIKCCKV